MTNLRDHLVHPPRRLPDLALATLGGAACPLRPGGRRSSVLVLVHSTECAACAAFVVRLAAAADGLRAWDGEVRVIVPAAQAGSPSASPFTLLVDAEQRVATALGITPPAVVIADQWGEVHDVREAAGEHRFPAVEEIESWLRYLAIQCPECQGEAL